MSAELPSPFDFLNHRRFLEAWFEAKKAANPRFSHRLFARLADQKSPSLLLNVIEGRRNLTPPTTEAFITAMGLRKAEAQHFKLLVELDLAADPEARDRVWLQIAASRRFREARRVDVCAVEYLSSWWLPAIRELVRRRDFREDPAWIGAQLRPTVGPADVVKAIETMLALGLLAREGDRLVPVEVSVSTPTDVAGMAVRSYHRGMIGLAAEAIDRFPSAERHLLAVTVGVPESLLPVLKAEANAFLERMMHLCDSSQDPSDRVLQMNLQFFPLTGPVGDEP